MPHEETRVGRFEFDRDEIERISRVEFYCRKAETVFPDSFKKFIKYILIFAYVNASLEIIEDKENKGAVILRDALVEEIYDLPLLDFLDEKINEGL